MPRFVEKSKPEPRRWFRFYAESVNDPKVQRLPPHLFKTWVNLLCLASANGGTLPARDDIAFQLRMSDHDASSQLDELIGLALIDVTGDKTLEPHNWKGRQFVSDTSGDRVARHRNKRKERGLTKSAWINPKVRAEVFARDNHQCVYCESVTDLTIDHKTPEHRGGTSSADNLQVACRACNASKRDMTHDEFVTWNGRVTLHVTEGKRPQNTETEAKTEPPKVPHGDGDGNAVAKPIDLRTAFRPADENEGVIHTDGGTVRLVNGTRAYWLKQFGGNEQRLDLALRQVQIQPQSRIPIRSQVERQLARIASDKLDRDQRYQAAVVANKPAAQPRKLSRW